jgi:hypothetical protein
MTTSFQLRRESLDLFHDKSGPRLYDRIVEVVRVRHQSRRTEGAYLHWIRRLILSHNCCTGVPHESTAIDIGTHSPRTFWPTANKVRTVHDLLEHKDVRMTMSYTHLLNRAGAASTAMQTDWLGRPTAVRKGRAIRQARAAKWEQRTAQTRLTRITCQRVRPHTCSLQVIGRNYLKTSQSLLSKNQ